MKKQIALVALGIVLLFGVAPSFGQPTEHWPAVPDIDPSWSKIIATAAENPRARQFSPTAAPYTADGAFLYFSERAAARDGPNVQLDPDGLPKTKYGKKFYYNPVSLSQFALAEYGRGHEKNVIAAVDHLITMIGDDGALRYPFPFRHYVATLPLKTGWTSGMAQGQFLSAAGRAYKSTGDDKYIDAGNKVLAFLQTRHPYGPMTDMSDLDPSLHDYIFFLEYPSEPNVYTLNGFMFTLLGLYDWSDLANSQEAAGLFQQGIKTLEKILPYYDLGKITAYDLGHITHPAQPFQVDRRPHIAARYHAVHVMELRALYSVTGNSTLHKFAEKWAAY